MARAGNFDDIRDLFTPQLRPMVTSEAVRVAWAAELERRGTVIAVGEPVSETAGPGVILVKIPVTCERGTLALLVSMTESGELVGLQLAPSSAAERTVPWEPPTYANPEAFDELDVMLGSGPLAVPGTLSLPRGAGPFPAVILLAGSGVMDRDETIGRNKPFKDLAWGLATLGVVVLRFDKVTFAHPQEVKQMPDFTVADEYNATAIAAVRLLEKHAKVEPASIFLVGHSLGGTVAPRIAQGVPSIAGIVLLAGGTVPLYWSAVRQVRYLASLNPETAAASRAAIEAMSNQARMVDSPELTLSTPPGNLPFGAPAPYWLDLRAYDPVAVAAALDRPILILQGGRDYQVTVDEDLERWTTGLEGRPDVTVRVYPGDNHLFFFGSGPSSPAEYEPAQHVDPTVVADVAAWVRTSEIEPHAEIDRS
jgi:hypothetical protein